MRAVHQRGTGVDSVSESIIENEDAWRAILTWALENGAHAFANCHSQTELDAYIAGYEAVFAVWPRATGDFQATPIKGRDAYNNAGGIITVTAIPCANREAVMDLLKRHGDPAWIDDAPAPPPKIKLKLVFSADG